MDIEKPEFTYVLMNYGYDEDVEHERDAAWDDVYATFPDAEYIESF